MSKSPTGIIPESLMFPGKLREVMALLAQVPASGDDKVAYLVGWAKMVGVKVSASQRDAVRVTGVSG